MISYNSYFPLSNHRKFKHGKAEKDFFNFIFIHLLNMIFKSVEKVCVEINWL